MTSAGGLLPVADAADAPAALLLSGPAGGVRAAAAAAVANGFPDAITFDMGGTSTDVCLVLGGAPAPAAAAVGRGVHRCGSRRSTSTRSAPAAARSPRLDPGGALVVGPRSAGAAPGPGLLRARRRRARRSPTPIWSPAASPPARRFGGLALDRDAARRALARAGRDAPRASSAWSTPAWSGRLRAVSVERGVDPRGAGARGLRRRRPAARLRPRRGPRHGRGHRAGPRRRALGRRAAHRPVQRDLVRSWPRPSDHTGLDAALAASSRDRGRRARRRRAPSTTTAVDCRYAGQSHELTVPTVADFHEAHRLRNGFARPDAPIEVVALRATATIPSVLDLADLPAPDRPAGLGPASVAEPDCTIWVPAGWAAEPGAAGALVLRREAVVSLDPAGAPGADLPSRRHRRRDGRGAAAVGVEPEHQGAGRLLGGGVHRRRRAARAGRAHPRAPRLDAGVGARRDRRVRRRARDPATRWWSTTRSPAARTSTTSPSSRPPSPTARLVGWAANRAHHADVGGAAPGSIPADATDIQQEGLRIPPTRYSRELRGLLLAASRTPDERAGDLDAQLGANVVGAARLADAGRRAPLDEVVAYGERRMRAVLAGLPDGRWRFEDVLDSTGVRAGTSSTRHGSLVTVTLAGEEITFDFTGTDPQAAATSTRVEAVTVSAVAFALRTAIDPTIPANGGSLRPVHVVAPAGTIVAAQPARGRGRGQRRGEPARRRRLPRCPRPGPARPGRGRRQGTMNNVLDRRRRLGVLRDRRGRRGRASPDRDGMSGVHTAMTNTQEHADRGAGAGLPAAGAALPAAGGERGSGPVPRRRGHRARPPGARRLHREPDHRAARVRSRGGCRAAARGRSARTGCCPVATRAGPSGCRTSAPSGSRPATSSGCSPPAGAAGGPPRSAVRNTVRG